MLRKTLRKVFHAAQDWLAEPKTENDESSVLKLPPPFDYEDSNRVFKQLVKQFSLRRPHFLWGALQGVNLAKALNVPRVSFVEFGVAGGNGLTALERIAEVLHAVFDVEIEIYGFDAVGGMPKATDYRDTPNLWQEGFYPMTSREELEKQLTCAKLHLGLIEQTVVEFVQAQPAPVAFVEFDFGFYSATRKALQIFEADQSLLMPRVHCFFRNVLGRTYGDFNGERLAMSEFNAGHDLRKVSKIYGLNYYLGANTGRWLDQYYMAHVFDHELYGQYDGLIREAALDLRISSTAPVSLFPEPIAVGNGVGIGSNTYQH